jgi:hypothetical protein
MMKQYLARLISSNRVVDGKCDQLAVEVPRHFALPGLFSPSLDAHYIFYRNSKLNTFPFALVDSKRTFW